MFIRSFVRANGFAFYLSSPILGLLIQKPIIKMKTAALIVRILHGAAFVFFGVNAFHPLMKQPPPPSGLAGDFVGALHTSHYFYVVAACQIIGGVCCLLASRLVPLGLLFLGPVIVNILCFHIFLLPANSAPGFVMAALALFLLFVHRRAFAGLLSGPPAAPKKE